MFENCQMHRNRSIILLVIIPIILAACASPESQFTEAAEEVTRIIDVEATRPVNQTEVETPADEELAAGEDISTAEEDEAAEEAAAERVEIRWFVGLGTGSEPEQIKVQEEVVADFNASQDNIELVLEVLPFDGATDAFATQIASGNGPDVIGPVGWGGSNAFFNEWLDMEPYIDDAGFDTSIFDPVLMDFYQTQEGQVGLPFAVFPGVIFYVPAIFDEAGLSYPPQSYGEPYMLDGEMMDWNWETVTEAAKRLTIDIDGNNATEPDFDPDQIAQVGFSLQWLSHSAVATYHGGAAKIFIGDAPGSYESNILQAWKESWEWWHDGMYGAEPFLASAPFVAAAEFGGGNLFNSGRAAMALTQMWYTCCLYEFSDAGHEFQLGIQPMLEDGTVQGRIDGDTFRIWKGTDHPEEAFAVLSYLVTDGADKLLPIYGAMPAIAEKTDAFFEEMSVDYPFVTAESWDVFVQGLAYPDVPSAEQYLPNWNEAFDRIFTHGSLLENTEDVDFDSEFAKLEKDLTIIYNK